MREGTDFESHNFKKSPKSSYLHNFEHNFFSTCATGSFKMCWDVVYLYERGYLNLWHNSEK